jgi:FAD/FMN-containing dehydrogenase
MSTELIARLRAAVGDDHVLQGADAAPHCADWRGRYRGDALAVALPGNTEEVAAVVRLCAEAAIAVVPQGGNTSLCGGAVPVADSVPQLVLNLSRMNRIRGLDAANYTMVVEAGCTLEAACAAADGADRLFPLGLTAIAPHCEIGGNISTNAGGIGVLRYGTARALVLGLEVVLPDGRVWDGMRSLRKDNTGYDLKQLFIGAEGTLGIITAAVLKLFPRPRATANACIAVRDPAAAVELLAHLRARCGDTISAFELISRSSLELVFRHIPDTREPFPGTFEWIVLARLADVLPLPLDRALTDALQAFGAGVLEYTVTSDSVAAEAWWKLRKNISEAQKREGVSVKHDVSVPVSRVAEFIARADDTLGAAYPGVRIVAFGHLGDGNIHYNASMPDADRNREFIGRHEHEVNRLVYDVAAALGGSISAEHGLGQLKREEIRRYKSGVELELMRAIKEVVDPRGLMNPGKVL